MFAIDAMAANWKRILTWVIGLAFLIAIIFTLVNAFSAKPSPAGLMMDTITLRETNATVERAELITGMDKTVKELKDPAISAQWAGFANCISGNVCTQDDYFDFLLMVATEKADEVPHAELITNAITVNRYWGNSEKIIDFSKALSDANAQVEQLGLKTIANKWREIVACDGKCPQYHDLFFDFIRLLLSV